jgi:hypothetical protein
VFFSKERLGRLVGGRSGGVLSRESATRTRSSSKACGRSPLNNRAPSRAARADMQVQLVDQPGGEQLLDDLRAARNVDLKVAGGFGPFDRGREHRR